jgi:formylmethanofuran dehydrogenase subunit C
MPLTLEFRAHTSLPIEADGLVQAALAATSADEVARTLVWHGNRQENAGEFFEISGNCGDGQVTIRGDVAGVHRLGEGMTAGMLRIEGDAGRHLGAAMRGGEIHVHGSAGDFAGAEMRDGLIHVAGNAGNCAGGAYVGSQRGMRGGTLLIDGNAGSHVGHTMRRGLIAIGGDVGDFVALNMIAGTVLVGGTCGARAGAAMRRGTIVAFGRPPEMLPTFRRSSTARPSFLAVYLRFLSQRGFAVDAGWPVAEFTQFSGDHLNGGRGEIFVRRAV